MPSSGVTSWLWHNRLKFINHCPPPHNFLPMSVSDSYYIIIQKHPCAILLLFIIGAWRALWDDEIDTTGDSLDLKKEKDNEIRFQNGLTVSLCGSKSFLIRKKFLPNCLSPLTNRFWNLKKKISWFGQFSLPLK
jgi:hypothetical protein